MKWILGTLVMLFAISMVAQQNENNQSGSEEMPGAMSYLSTASNSTVRHNIQSTFDLDPDFNSSNISTTVDRNSVILDGNVLTFNAKDEALQVASEYAGKRQVIDRLWMGGVERGD